MSGSAEPAAGSTTGHAWRAFMVLGSIEFLTVMDASVVNIALPDIRAELGLAVADASWVVNSYLITFAGLLLVAGSLADAIGRRGLFVTGTVAFTAASALCGVASTPGHLFAGRAIQGVGAALVMPSAIALITTIFPVGPDRVRALGIFSGMAGIAAPLGLALGGLLTAMDWHLIFWVNIPIGLAVTIAAVAWLPAPGSTANRPDLVAAMAGLSTLSLLCFAAISVERHGPVGFPTIAATAGAAVAAVTFIARQRSAEHPLVPAALLRAPSVLWGNAIFVAVGTSLLGTFYVVTLYLQEVRGLDPIQAMLIYLPVPLAMLAGTQLAPKLIGRRGVRTTLGLGLALQSAGLIAWVLASGADTNLIATHLLPILVWSSGLGLAIVSSFVACTSTAPGGMEGIASGLATTAYQGGGAIGLALVAALAAVGDTGASGQLATELDGYHSAMGALAVLTAAAAVASRVLPRS